MRTRTPIAAPIRNKIARPYLVDLTVREVSRSGSGFPSAVVRVSWIAVGTFGAELTGSRTSGACWGWTVITLWKWPMLSWEVRPGRSTTVALSRTRTA